MEFSFPAANERHNVGAAKRLRITASADLDIMQETNRDTVVPGFLGEQFEALDRRLDTTDQ